MSSRVDGHNVLPKKRTASDGDERGAEAESSSKLEQMRKEGKLYFDTKALGQLVRHRLKSKTESEGGGHIPKVSRPNMAALGQLLASFTEDLGKQLCKEAELGAIGIKSASGTAGSRASMQGIIIEDEDLESAMGQVLAEYMCQNGLRCGAGYARLLMMQYTFKIRKAHAAGIMRKFPGW